MRVSRASISCRIGHDVVLVVIEPPDVAERAERDVELAARQRAGLGGLAAARDRVLADGHGRDAGILVHADDVAAVFQTLSSDSRRSNSRNTCSNVSSARASSVAHAVSVSCEPIETRDRSIT